MKYESLGFTLRLKPQSDEFPDAKMDCFVTVLTYNRRVKV
jgi:hypothetical protein